MRVTNHSAGPVALPNGVEIKAGATADVSDADWKAAAGHPVVKQWLADKAISAKGDDKPAAKVEGKPAAVNPLA